MKQRNFPNRMHAFHSNVMYCIYKINKKVIIILMFFFDWPYNGDLRCRGHKAIRIRRIINRLLFGYVLTRRLKFSAFLLLLCLTMICLFENIFTDAIQHLIPVYSDNVWTSGQLGFTNIYI